MMINILNIPKNNSLIEITKVKPAPPYYLLKLNFLKRKKLLNILRRCLFQYLHNFLKQLKLLF